MCAYPLLTIAIPTFNRASYLEQTLHQLQKEISENRIKNVEIIVSDNASPDGTGEVVNHFISIGLPIRYVRNAENIGSDANIAQCFNQSNGKYVLILGDDDLFVDGGLRDLLKNLHAKQYGVVCLKSYGFDADFRTEYPGLFGRNKIYISVGSFLSSIGSLMTLISGCVINKSLLSHIDANDYCGENLVQAHLVIQAACRANRNLFIDRYLMACKRNNSGGYDFAKVFVENVGNILDSYVGNGLSKNNVLAIERKFILTYFPFYLMKQRFYQQGDIAKTYQRFSKRYNGRYIFYIWLYPILRAPRWIAIIWGAFTTLFGRTLNGDLIRGIAFAANKIRRAI